MQNTCNQAEDANNMETVLLHTDNKDEQHKKNKSREIVEIRRETVDTGIYSVYIACLQKLLSVTNALVPVLVYSQQTTLHVNAILITVITQDNVIQIPETLPAVIEVIQTNLSDTTEENSEF